MSILSVRVFGGSLERVTHLIEDGADVNQSDGLMSPNNPLIFAVHREFGDIVTVLLESGADPNWMNPLSKVCYAPLHVAAIKLNWIIAERLLDYGADINMLDTKGHTALFYAMTPWKPLVRRETQKVLVDGLVSKGGRVADICEALNAVARNGSLHFVNILLKWGVSQDAKDSALFKALLAREKDVANALHKEGAVPQNSSLHRAAQCGCIDIVVQLLNNGADPLQEDKYGSTAIQDARDFGHPDIVKLMEQAA